VDRVKVSVLEYAPVRAATLVLTDDAAAAALAELGVEVRVTGG